MDALAVSAREQAGVTYTTVTHLFGAASRRRSSSSGAVARAECTLAAGPGALQPLLLSLLCHLTELVKRYQHWHQSPKSAANAILVFDGTFRVSARATRVRGIKACSPAREESTDR